MSSYQKTDQTIWTGRSSKDQLYFYEKVTCIDIEHQEIPNSQSTSFAILGYGCDEGVRRNQGRIGAASAPNVVRSMMSSLSNHLPNEVSIIDSGTIICENNDLEKTQIITSVTIHQLLKKGYFPIVIGGGHDIAYAHYNGIKTHTPTSKIGIINLDAHFDLRNIETQGNSGTPFSQIANENDHFKYLCLGIQEASNNRTLFKTAKKHQVQFITNNDFTLQNKEHIISVINSFISSVDHIYLTIDMDGFSSTYAPGVSAPSPFGFTPDIAVPVIEHICSSGKLLSVDIAELNPIYDIDNCTTRLAARLLYHIMRVISS